MSLYALGTVAPQVHPAAWVVPNATLIGDVHIQCDVSIWWQAVLRGDNDPIRVGQGSNIQDGSVLHTDKGQPLDVAEMVTVGHRVILHSCRIGKGCLIGMNSVILNGAQVGEGCLIGANTLITEDKVIPAHSLVLGSPGKIVRSLCEQEVLKLLEPAHRYMRNMAFYKKQLRTC